jgi:hypothetical protein
MSDRNGFPHVDQQLNHFFAATQCKPGVRGFVNPDGVCVQKGFVDSAPFAPVGPPGTCQMEVPDLDLRSFQTDVVVLSQGARKDWSVGTPGVSHPLQYCPAQQGQVKVPGIDCYFRG